MKVVVFDEQLDAKSLERNILSYFITHRIDGEEILTFTDFSSIRTFAQEPANCDNIFFLSVSVGHQEYAGIEIANQIRAHNKSSHIVFMSSQEKHTKRCLSGLIRPSQILQKPVHQKELTTLIGSIYKDNLVDTLRIQISGTSYFIRISKIMYVEKCGKKLIFHSATDTLESYGTLTTIHRKCGGELIYANKGQLVNKNAITRIEQNRNSMELSNGDTIFVSRGMKRNFRNL